MNGGNLNFLATFFSENGILLSFHTREGEIKYDPEGQPIHTQGSLHMEEAARGSDLGWYNKQNLKDIRTDTDTKC